MITVGLVLGLISLMGQRGYAEWPFDYSYDYYGNSLLKDGGQMYRDDYLVSIGMGGTSQHVCNTYRGGPVCTTNGQSWLNKCFAQLAGVQIACEKRCPCFGVSKSERGKPTYEECTREQYYPVCTTTGQVLNNYCLAMFYGQNVACYGNCPCSFTTTEIPQIHTEKPTRIECLDAPKQKVCSTTNQAAESECWARYHGLEVACYKDCPCETTDTPRPPITERPITTECSREPYNPVCTTTGQVLDNDCLARLYGQKVACYGNCPCSFTTTEAPTQCENTDNPVCSTSGNQFRNECWARYHGHTVECHKVCPCSLPTETPRPTTTVSPIIRECSREPYNPVCTTTGQVLNNDCLARLYGQKVACYGNCPCSFTTTEPPENCNNGQHGGNVCGYDGSSYKNKCVAKKLGVLVQCDGMCPCGTKCIPDGRQVCASDGRVYYDYCYVTQIGLVVECLGRCPCEIAICTEDTVTVCGTNGITYKNKCLANRNGFQVDCEGMCPCDKKDPCYDTAYGQCHYGNSIYGNYCYARRYNKQVQCSSQCPCTKATVSVLRKLMSDYTGGIGDQKIVEKVFSPVCNKRGVSVINAEVAKDLGVPIDCNHRCPCSRKSDSRNHSDSGIKKPEWDSKRPGYHGDTGYKKFEPEWEYGSLKNKERDWEEEKEDELWMNTDYMSNDWLKF